MNILDQVQKEKDNNFPRLTLASLLACIFCESIRFINILFRAETLSDPSSNYLLKVYSVQLVISLAGLILGITSLVKNSNYKTISWIGIILNSIYFLYGLVSLLQAFEEFREMSN